VIYDPMAMSAPPALHELEAEVMEEMWRLERATVRDDIYWPRLDRESYLEQRAQAEVQQLLADYGDHALVNFARAMQTLDPARVRALRRLAARD
jgi:predicted transcriptional regulator